MAAAPRIAFSHVGIYARDLARMEGFYTRFMGLVVTDRGPLETPGGRLTSCSSRATRASITSSCSHRDVRRRCRST